MASTSASWSSAVTRVEGTLRCSLTEYTFEVGGQTFLARPGDYVFGPRHVPHSDANRTGVLARTLIMVTPAGSEGFWRESARPGIVNCLFASFH
jgi:hypothetical protein